MALIDGGIRYVVQGFGQGLAKLGQLDKAQQALGKSGQSLGGQFTGLGKAALITGGVLGGAALAGVTALAGGLVYLGTQALDSYAKYERMSLSIQNLVAREISQGKEQITQKKVLAQLTADETAEIASLQQKLTDEALDRNTLAASIQEQRQRVIELTASYGENGLNVQTAKARLAKMENELGKSDAATAKMTARIAELNAKNGQLVTVTEKVRTGQMSMKEAMAQAGPEAKNLLDWISRLAIASPFDQQGIALAFKTAMTYGFTTKEATRLTEAEVDFAAATGASIEVTNQIALALGQMQAKGKVSGQELIQLTNAGIGTNAILAKMGFTLDDVSKGLVDSDKFIEAVVADMEIFKGAAKDQTSTFSGLLTSLGELKDVGLREFFTGTFQTIQPYLANFVNWATDPAVFDTLRSWGEVMGNKVANGLKKVQSIMKTMSESGIDFSGIFGAIQGGDFGQIASTIEANVALAFNTIKTKLMMAWGEIKGQILVWALETPGLLSGVILAFQSGNWENVGAIISANLALAWNTIHTQLAIWGVQFMDWVADVYPQIPTKLTGIINSITSAITTNWPIIKSALTEWGNKFWGWVNETAIPALNGAMIALAVALAAWATSSDAQTAMTNLGNALGKALTDALGLSLASADSSNLAMSQLAQGLLTAVATIAGTLIIIGGQIVAGILSGILESMGIKLEPATFSQLSTILNGIGTNIGIIASTIGNSIVTGITTGITTMQTQLETSLFDFCMGVIDYVKQIFGIASPSTVFAGYGADLILGFIQGITANAAKLFEAVGNLFSNLLTGGGTIDLTSLTTTLPQALLANLNNANALFLTLTGINNMISLLWPIALKALRAISAEVFGEMETVLATIEQKFSSIQSAISAVGSAIRVMGTTSATSLSVLNSALDVTRNKFSQLESAAKGAASASKETAKTAEKFTALKNAIDKVTDAFKAMEKAAKLAATAAGGAGNAGQAKTGIGLARGVGFAAGTPGNTGGLLGLGYQVPTGYPNDSFGPLYVQSGEQMLVTPRNTSIDEVVFNRIKALGMPAYGGAPSINVTVGSINNGMDLAMLQNIIERTVAQSFA